VSYPFPISVAVIAWGIMWFSLAGIIAQGGLHPRHVNAVTSFIAWVLYLFAALVGPFGVLSFSASLEVDAPRLVWRRWFGFRSLSFERTEIRDARLERRHRAWQVRIVLASGATIRFTQYASGFTKLQRYLGLPEAR